MVKKKELNPVMEEVKGKINDSDLKELLKGIDIIKTDSKDDADSFFRGVLNNLMNDKNISLKTEYLNVAENFSGAKLEFLSTYGNMPYLSEFIKIFETKRVSLERKSRKEIVMTLEKREQEIRASELQQQKTQFGY